MPTPEEIAADEATYRRLSSELADGLVAAVPAWVRRGVGRRVPTGDGATDDEFARRLDAAVTDTVASVEPRLREVLAADVDAAAVNPLQVLREAVGPATELLRRSGAEPVRRDETTTRLFPDDIYGLGPATFADVDQSLHEPGLVWGAARAHVHLRRHRPDDGRVAPAPVGSPAVSDAAPVPSDFDDILARVADVEGWMTDDQARRLHEHARRLGPGDQVVEIGSFRGRSMIVLAASAGEGVELVAIDPHGGGDRGPQEIAPDQRRGDEDNAAFEANLTAAGVRDRVRHVRRMSDEALEAVDGHVDLLYIDGAHRYAPARADIVDWGGRVRPGGTMLIHDSFSSIGVTLALLTTTFPGGRWRYVGRSQSMAEYRHEHLGPRDSVATAARQTAQLPWFVRTVVIKVLLTL